LEVKLDIIELNYDAILEYGNSLEIYNISIFADGLLSGLSITHNTREWIVKIENGEFALYHMSTSNNKKKSIRMHYEKSFGSYHMFLKRISESHNESKRGETSKNRDSISLWDKFSKIENNVK